MDLSLYSDMTGSIPLVDGHNVVGQVVASMYLFTMCSNERNRMVEIRDADGQVVTSMLFFHCNTATAFSNEKRM